MRRRFYFDLDLTLYNTLQLIELIRIDMVALGSREVDITRVSDELGSVGYTFEEHLRRLGYPSTIVSCKADEYRHIQNDGNRFLYEDVTESIKRFSAIGECHLLTFGFPAYQRHKFEGIKALQSHFAKTHYVWNGETKGDIVRTHREQDVEDWVLDDSFDQLRDIRSKAPWARLVRMCRPRATTTSHHEDGTSWFVATDLKTVLHHLEVQ